MTIFLTLAVLPGGFAEVLAMILMVLVLLLGFYFAAKRKDK